MNPAASHRIAIVGAGWAGMAAAVRATERGHAVTVFEAARTLGGRARGVPLTLPDGRDVMVDNGQHILIGAYTECLRLMRLVGVDVEQALLRLPLTLRYPDGSGLALPAGLQRTSPFMTSSRVTRMSPSTSLPLRSRAAAGP